MRFHSTPLLSQLVVESRLVVAPESSVWRSEWTVALTAVLVVLALLGARRILERREPGGSWISLRDQLIMLGLTAVGLIIVILTLPQEHSRNLLNLIGIVLSAAFALSSTTLLGNAMAGVMLRALRNFRPGGILRVGEHFGMVYERGLIHTEMQTPDGDLTTLPNLYLVSNPVTIMAAEGTVISATVSLGYDLSRTTVEEALIEAAGRCELEKPFVYALELGDFSVTWRVAGLLRDVEQVLSARSKLRKQILDVLSEGDIEVVSPTFMNTRALSPHEPVLPPMDRVEVPVDPGPQPESTFWGKGKAAAEIERMRAHYENLGLEIDALRGKLADGPEELRKASLEWRIQQLERRREQLADMIEAGRDPEGGAGEGHTDS